MIHMGCGRLITSTATTPAQTNPSSRKAIETMSSQSGIGQRSPVAKMCVSSRQCAGGKGSARWNQTALRRLNRSVVQAAIGGRPQQVGNPSKGKPCRKTARQRGKSRHRSVRPHRLPADQPPRGAGGRGPVEPAHADHLRGRAPPRRGGDGAAGHLAVVVGYRRRHIDQLLPALPGAPADAPAGRAVAAAHRQPGL